MSKLLKCLLRGAVVNLQLFLVVAVPVLITCLPLAFFDYLTDLGYEKMGTILGAGWLIIVMMVLLALIGSGHDE